MLGFKEDRLTGGPKLHSLSLDRPMAAFDQEQFIRRLIAETLFYDDEYGALGNLSLIDLQSRQERYLASYVPDDGTFIIEEATDWEDYEPVDGDEIGYALAVDSKEHGCFDSPEEAADALLQIARQQGLLPSVTLLFEEDEVA
jgi:hypothetical protein